MQVHCCVRRLAIIPLHCQTKNGLVQVSRIFLNFKMQNFTSLVAQKWNDVVPLRSSSKGGVTHQRSERLGNGKMLDCCPFMCILSLKEFGQARPRSVHKQPIIGIKSPASVMKIVSGLDPPWAQNKNVSLLSNSDLLS